MYDMTINIHLLHIVDPPIVIYHTAKKRSIFIPLYDPPSSQFLSLSNVFFQNMSKFLYIIHIKIIKSRGFIFVTMHVSFNYFLFSKFSFEWDMTHFIKSSKINTIQLCSSTKLLLATLTEKLLDTLFQPLIALYKPTINIHLLYMVDPPMVIYILWKNLVFLSPSLIHLVLALCLQKIFSICHLFTNSNINDSLWAKSLVNKISSLSFPLISSMSPNKDYMYIPTHNSLHHNLIAVFTAFNFWAILKLVLTFTVDPLHQSSILSHKTLSFCPQIWKEKDLTWSHLLIESWGNGLT